MAAGMSAVASVQAPAFNRPFGTEDMAGRLGPYTLFAVLLLLRNTDDFPKKPSLMGELTAENRRCYTLAPAIGDRSSADWADVEPLRTLPVEG